jgi:arabinose-5-phosphate isomerase
MDTMSRIQAILMQESDAVKNIPVTEGFEKAVELIHDHVHKARGKVIVSGMGKAGQIAENIATTFSSTGTPAVFLHPSNAQHGDLGVIQPDDLLLLISNSGKTREIIELVNLARRLYPSIPVILITGNPSSTLSGVSTLTLFTGNPQEVCPLGLTPTTSTTTMTVIGDILVVLLMEKIGFSPADYAMRHHGGYLGEKSRNAARNNEK